MTRLPVMMFAACLASAAARAEGDIAFTLTNASAQPVAGFFAGLPGEAEVNLLTGALEPQASAEIVIPAGQSACVRHLRIVFTDQTARDRPDVDLCNMDGYLIE